MVLGLVPNIIRNYYSCIRNLVAAYHVVKGITFGNYSIIYLNVHSQHLSFSSKFTLSLKGLDSFFHLLLRWKKATTNKKWSGHVKLVYYSLKPFVGALFISKI